MPRVSNAGYLAASLVLLVAIAAVLVWLQRMSTPVHVADPGSARIACVSYAPFRRPGESPFNPGANVSPTRILEDLKLLHERTDCVRTYSVNQGLDAVPAVAAGLGMRVMMGVWIGSDPHKNAAEIARAREVVRTHPQSIDAIVVGNEVLLRRELPANRLIELITQVREATDIPVTYADVWEFWLKNRSVADAVDFVTVHILPYWEDHPVGIDDAVAHVRDTLKHMAAEFPRHRLFIGETGWPSAGRMRGAAAPGVVEQARFIREWVRAAEQAGIAYNLIEAFDQPWKRQLEGAMGGHWGMLDSQGRPKFDWRGEVTAAPRLMRIALLSALPAVSLALASLWCLRPRRYGTGMTSRWPPVVAGLAGMLAGLLLPLQWHYLALWSRDAWEWGVAGLYTVLGLLAAMTLAPLLARAPSLPGVVAVLRHGEPGDRFLAMLWVWARAALLFGCAYFVVLHIFDARYRGFAVALYILPAVALVVPWVVGLRVPATAIHERVLGLLILLPLPFLLWSETLSNTQALVFLSLACMVGTAAVWPGVSSDVAPLPSSSNTPSNTPKAPGSTA